MSAVAPRVTVEEAQARLEAGDDIVFLDLRRGSYERSDVKIAGAIRIEPDEGEEHLDELPQGALIVPYCTCPSEGTSARAALLLNERGYDAAALVGGFDSWVDAGYPTEPK